MELTFKSIEMIPSSGRFFRIAEEGDSKGQLIGFCVKLCVRWPNGKVTGPHTREIAEIPFPANFLRQEGVMVESPDGSKRFVGLEEGCQVSLSFEDDRDPEIIQINAMPLRRETFPGTKYVAWKLGEVEIMGGGDQRVFVLMEHKGRVIEVCVKIDDKFRPYVEVPTYRCRAKYYDSSEKEKVPLEEGMMLAIPA